MEKASGSLGKEPGKGKEKEVEPESSEESSEETEETEESEETEEEEDEDAEGQRSRRSRRSRRRRRWRSTRPPRPALISSRVKKNYIFFCFCLYLFVLAYTTLPLCF